MKFENVTELLSPWHLPYASGIERLDNGILHVAALTRMPRVSPKMLGWWFGEYLSTTEHYRRWHPRDHVWMDWADKSPGTHVNAKHLVHEYVGGKLHKLRISFLPQSSFFGDALAKDASVLAICAKTGLLEHPIDVGRMVHFAVPTDWGCELHSRFWLGYVESRSGNRALERIGNLPTLRRLLATEAFGRALLVHCHEEMTILSEFLPALHAAQA